MNKLQDVILEEYLINGTVASIFNGCECGKEYTLDGFDISVLRPERMKSSMISDREVYAIVSFNAGTDRGQTFVYQVPEVGVFEKIKEFYRGESLASLMFGTLSQSSTH